MARDLRSFDLNCTNAAVSPNSGSSVTVSLSDVDQTDVMDLVDINEYIDYVGEEKILDQFDEATVRKHFDIPDSEE